VVSTELPTGVNQTETGDDDATIQSQDPSVIDLKEVAANPGYCAGPPSPLTDHFALC